MAQVSLARKSASYCSPLAAPTGRLARRGGAAIDAKIKPLQQRILRSGLVPEQEIDAVLVSLAQRGSALGPQFLARELVRRTLLTPYQARVLCKGKSDPLVLGRYVLLDEIGRGGSGRVFKAEHRGLKRVVALKILSAGSAAPEMILMRFRREMAVTARLDHPNVVAVYDAGIANGHPYLVMQHVDGSNLAERVREQGPLPIKIAVDYVLQAARGLAHAHCRGIVHRDVKPANLIVDQGGTVRILDLGLARIVSPSSASESIGLTRHGVAMGTVDFMAPEQAANTREADARADIYSLGATCFFLLTGRPLYDGGSVVERLLAHRDQPIPSLRPLRNDLPASLDTILHRMLAKRPEDRYQAMTDVIADLENLAGQEAPRETPPKEVREQDPLGDFLSSIDRLRDDSGSALTGMRRRHSRSLRTLRGPSIWLRLCNWSRAAERLGRRRERILVGGTIATVLLGSLSVLAAT